MTQLSRERIEQYISDPLEYGLTRSEQMEMARRLLAAEAQEPVAMRWRWINGDEGPGAWWFHDTVHFEKLSLCEDRECELVYAAPPPVAVPELTVWYGPMPESNGKTNWTASLHRKGDPVKGFTIDRSEYPDRVRYEADRMRWLIGELPDEPDILEYDENKHSGYFSPKSQSVAVPDEITREEYKRRFMEEADFDNTFRGGWNACRAAMLNAEPVSQPYTLPDGWKLVPVEPTPEMVAKMRYHNGGYDMHIKNGYAAMLAAASQEPTK